MDKAPQVKLHSTAHYFLEGLNDIGIEYLFSNFGTDHAPLIEEMARWKKEGWHYPEGAQLPAREHGDAHGRGVRHGDRPRAGGDGARRRGHGEFGDGDAQRAPRAAAAGADRGQGAVHGARRTAGLARQLRALHPGALRPGRDRAALREVGVDAALGGDDQGNAAPRAQRGAQRSDGPGVPDAAARNADADLGRGGDAGVSARSATARCPPAPPMRPPVAQIADKLLVREAPGDGHLLRRAQHRGAGADRGDRAPRRHPRVRGQPALSQYLARLAVLRRNDAGHRRSRCRAAGGRGRAVDPQEHQGKSRRPGGRTSTSTW